MQDAALEVESNILVAHRLKGSNDRTKSRESPSSSSVSNPKLDKMSKMIESLTAEMAKLKVENQQNSKGKGAYEQPNRNFNRNPNNFRRNTQPQVQILQRDRITADDQNINTPLQNAVFEDDDDDYEIDEDNGDNINCVEADIENSFLTQDDYEEALISEQIESNTDDGIIFQTDDKGRYNLR